MLLMWVDQTESNRIKAADGGEGGFGDGWRGGVVTSRQEKSQGNGKN